MEIYKINLKSGKNSNLFVVQTDKGEYVVHSDIIVKDRLAVGQLDDEKFFKSVEESDQIVAFNVATKYISSSMKTEKQIKDYLYKKEFKTKTINAVLQKMKDYNLINDSLFATSYIRSNPSYSVNKLKQKLLGFGVKKEQLSELICDLSDEGSCKASAEKFLKNKPHSQKVKEKLIRHLLNKGFNWGDVSKVLQQYEFDADEQDEFFD